jgi:phenylacetic acid degradation operon negative regulatory protein
MTKPHALLTPFLDRLHDGGRLRVWSIVISIFGEMVLHRGVPLSMQELLAFTDHLGIEGGALRTAMSRLAKEGWVKRIKQGRNSFYSLSSTGEKASGAASARIYEPNFVAPDAQWYLAISQNPLANPDAPLTLLRQIRILSSAQRKALADPDALILHGEPEQLPDWVKTALIPESLTQEYTALAALLVPLQNAQADIAAMDPLDAATLRVLLIHFWRRLILRHPLLPVGLIEPGWPGAQCHAALSALYPAVVSASEPLWETATSAAGRAKLDARFTDGKTKHVTKKI